MTERTVFVRENRRWRVIPHGADSFLAVLCHRGQHGFQLLHRIPCCNLTAAQIFAGMMGNFLDAGGFHFQIRHGAGPIGKRQCGGKLVLDFRIPEQQGLFHVDRQHLTGAKRTLFNDIDLVNRHHPGFRPGNQQIITGHDVPHGPQTVPVQPGTDPATIGHHQRRRAIPGLHDRIGIGIHILPCLRHILGR